MALDDQDTSTATTNPNIDIKADAKRVFDVLVRGGIAIIPVDVGYGWS